MQMFVEKYITECDFTERKYETPVLGAAVVARGATGRYCEVIHAGPEFLKEKGVVVVPYDQAVIEVQALGNGFVDF
jgi:hypothetical protein